ncbi:MAG TPA: hypothetical protein VFV93_15615 [Thermomicrobiales bacterium]|nr:hypothetical protein [Thermomicrobiales bacterium]
MVAQPSDPANALLALDVTVQIRGAFGERQVPPADLFAVPAAERVLNGSAPDAATFVRAADAVLADPRGAGVAGGSTSSAG